MLIKLAQLHKKGTLSVITVFWETEEKERKIRKLILKQLFSSYCPFAGFVQQRLFSRGVYGKPSHLPAI